MSGFPLLVGSLTLFLVSWGGRAAVAAEGVAPQLPLLLLLCWTLPGDLLLLEELSQAGLQLSVATGCGLLICAYSYKASRAGVLLVREDKVLGCSVQAFYLVHFMRNDE